MDSVENGDFARVVLAEGFCTREQIDRCLKIQSSTNERLSLGNSLLREGFITTEQYSQVLHLLRQGFRKERDTAVVRKAAARRAEDRDAAMQGQEDRVLGQILIAEGFISSEELQSCLDGEEKDRPPLAETLVARGYVQRAQIDSVKARLERYEVSCPSCGATLSILRLPTTKEAHCPRCRRVLSPP